MNDFKMARKAAGMTVAQAAEACGIAAVTYYGTRDKDPSSFRLGELKDLYKAMPDMPKSLLIKAVSDFICS